MIRIPRKIQERQAQHATRLQNALVVGAGAGTTNDFGAMQTASMTSSSPYYNNNYFYRYQQYVNLYETSWEARKIIDIPVDDAMRSPTLREGLTPEDDQVIADAWQQLGIERQLRRALKQERLLGGAVLLAILKLQNGERLDEPLNERNIEKGDLLALNVIDVSKLSRTGVYSDPFCPEYDAANELSIDGIAVDVSRMVVFDGNALFGRNSQRLMMNFRYNPLGFGESKLVPIWDILIRALGTQQGAYHLVNRASELIISVENLRSIKAMDNAAEGKLRDIARQLSIYNSAIVDGKDVNIDTKAASFGSVPELVLTFTQFLAAASDIPITRFMGSSAQGLSATGEGDARNYYDMVDSIRNNTRKPAERRIIDWIGWSTYGYDEWNKRSKDLTLSYDPLWNMDAVQQATRDEIITRTVVSLYQSQMISAEAAIKELNKREIFDTELEAEQALMDTALEPSGVFGDEEGSPQGGEKGGQGGPQKSGFGGTGGQGAQQKSGFGGTGGQGAQQKANFGNAVEFDESKVKRDEGGRFTTGGGGSAPKKPELRSQLDDIYRKNPKLSQEQAAELQRIGTAIDSAKSKEDRARIKEQLDSFAGKGEDSEKNPAPKTPAPKGQSYTKEDKRAAFDAYVSQNYMDINSALREGSYSSLDPENKRYTDIMTDAIDKSPIPHDKELTRAMTVSSSDLSKYTAGATVKDSGFMSTSEGKDRYKASIAAMTDAENQKMVGENVTPVVLSLTAKKGTKGINVSSVTGSNYNEENEFILQRGSSYKITKAEYRKNKDGDLYYHVTADVVQ